MLRFKDDGFVIECDICQSSTEEIAGQLPTVGNADSVANAFGFIKQDNEGRHVCPACRVSGVAL